MKKESINEILGINESFKLPAKLMGILLDKEKSIEVFDRFMAIGEDLGHDWFTSYFEEEHANKSQMAQDFTPPAVCDLLAQVVGSGNRIADICAGTGGLTIGMWVRNPQAEFLCLELSERAIPLLLFNLAIRNVSARVCRMDILTQEMHECFAVSRGDRYGTVERAEPSPLGQADCVVSNPPYSLKYKPIKNEGAAFGEFAGILPSNFADYVFIAFGLQLCREGGSLGYILPHGVLFRGNKEAQCRKLLIERGWLRSVVGLPDKLFINTDIPTCILGIKKEEGAAKCIRFVNGEKECRKEKAKNAMDGENVSSIMRALMSADEIERVASTASLEQIQEQDYNLNIPRHIDMYVPEPLPDIDKVCEDLLKLEREIERTKKSLARMMEDLTAQDVNDASAVRKYIAYLRGPNGRKKKGSGQYEQMFLELPDA